jgi:tetratricopeptide (TPR) repeat protein
MSADAGAGGALTRAEHLLEIHRPQEALRVLAATLAQDPDNGTVLCLAARAELALKEPGRARELAARAAAAQPHAEYPLRLLALSLSDMGRSDEACEAAEAAVACAPNLWQTHHALAHVCSGVPGKTSVAWDAARRAVELAPHEAETHAVLGRVAVDDENQTAAEKSLREALRLNPDHAGARNDLGRLHVLRKDHFGAARHFAHAAASDVRLDVAQHNIDAAIAMAVGRVVFWVSIAVFVIGRIALEQKGDVAVGWGYVLLTVLIGLAIWQIVLVVPAARGGLGPYLRLLPHRDKAMTATVALLVFGMIALMVMCVVPPESRYWAFFIGAPALLGSRILLEVRANKLKKAIEG